MIIRVLLADDHTLFREGLRALLQATDDIRIVGEVANGRDALSQAAELSPDVLVMDVAMPDLNGIEAARAICARCPATRILMLSMHSTSQSVHLAFAAGVRGYVLKEDSGTELIMAIRSVHRGSRYLCEALRGLPGISPTGDVSGRSPLDRLSAKERQVLQLMVEGKRTVEIADALRISPRTVETYRTRLMHKLDIDDLPGLVKFAVQNGLTPLQ